MKYVILLIIALMLGGAAEADGAKMHPTTDPVPLALTAATSYWGGAPPCGTPTVVEEEEPAGLIKENGGFTPLLERGEAVTLAWTSSNESCVIHLNPKSYWWDWKNEDEMFHLFCDTMTHEMGHLFGHGDDGQTNPASIQYPLLDPVSPNFDSVPQCEHTTVWYGGRRYRT